MSSYITTALALIDAIGAWVAVCTPETAAAQLSDSLLKQTAVAEGIGAMPRRPSARPPFLYRIATFWLPILPGVFALKKVEPDGAL